MRKTIVALLGALFLVVSGCQKGDTPEVILPPVSDQPPLEQITYSNLGEESVRKELDQIMADAGIEDARRQVFFDHVEQFNSTVSTEGLAAGYETELVGAELPYDPYAMQDQWMAKYPDFLGYNCRITSFGLFGDRVSAPAQAEVREDMLAFDLSALATDPAAVPDQEAMHTFSALWSTVPTQATKDVSVHADTLMKDWKERGITFAEDPKVSLISVVFHDAWEEGKDFLFVGHAGLLFPVGDEFYFVEKLAFQEPYQMVKVKNRVELSDYLMSKYDLNVDQPTASPFIMENDQVMEGYRPKPQ